MAQLMNSLLQNSDLKQVGKTTRLCKWDLIKSLTIIVKVRDRFKGLNLIECLKNYGWIHKSTGGKDKNHPQEREIEKAKWLSEKALKIAEKREN